MKSKRQMINEIYDAMSGFRFNSPKASIVNISSMYKDYETVEETYLKVKRGIISPQMGMEYLSGCIPQEINQTIF